MAGAATSRAATDSGTCVCKEGGREFYAKDAQTCDFDCAASGGGIFTAPSIDSGSGAAVNDYGSCVASRCTDLSGNASDDCENQCQAQYNGLGGDSVPALPIGGDSVPDQPSSKTTGPSSVSLPDFMGVKSVSGLIVKIIDFLIPLATVFAVFMLIWAGFLFVTAQGNQTKLDAAKKNFLWTIAGIAVIMASQAIVTYITDILGGGSGQGNALVEKIKGTLNQVIGLLFILVTVYFFWGVVEYVRSSASGDSAKLEEGKKHMIWGIIGMTVMAGAWGIVQMIQVYFQ